MSKTTKSPDGGASRNRRLVRGILTSFITRAVAALAPLAMIPMLLPTLGPSTYGVWMTAVSVTAMLVWADLGLGNGLLTRLSKHLSHEDHDSGRREIMAAYSIVTTVALVLSALALASPLIVSWPALLNPSGEDADSVLAIALVCLLCFCANMPLSLIQRVQYASQQVGISNTFTATGPLISLTLSLGAVSSDMTPTVIVGAATIGPLIANAAATLWFFRRNPSLIPRLADRTRLRFRALLSLGSLFVLISTLSAFAYNADMLVIAHTLGAAHVAEYSVAARTMAGMGLLISLVNLPLWPASADALARGDTEWVSRTTRRMSLLSGGFVALSTLAVLSMSEQVVRILGQGLVRSDVVLFACLGLWWTVVAVTSPMMMVQNAAGVLLPQLIGWTLFLAASLPLRVVFIPQLGLYAGPLVGALVYCLLVFPFAVWAYRRSMAVARAGVGRGRPMLSEVDTPSPGQVDRTIDGGSVIGGVVKS